MRTFDVPLLRALIATTQQDDDLGAALDIVDPIARTIVDPQFHHASPDALGIAQIPLLHSSNPGNDPRDRVIILQAAQPCLERVRLMDFDHIAICSL
jgi:hypothetical protein